MLQSLPSKILIRCLFGVLMFIPVGLFFNQLVQFEHQTSKDFSWLDQYIDEYHSINGFSGTVLIAKGDEIVFKKAIGWQDVAKDIENTMDTRFNLGSGNKMFTAVAIAQLAEQGKIDYSAPISAYLPNYPDKAFASKATVHQLLTHSSGLGDFRDYEYKRNWGKLSSLSETLPYVINKTLRFEPGTGYSYSNSGFLVLGLIVEAVSGQDYFDYVRTNIYARGEMSRSDSYQRNGTIKDLAVPYQGFKDEWYIAEYGLMGTSAGGGFSTVKDILKFNQALYDNKLVSAETVQLLTTDKTPPNSERRWDYGYGFIDRENEGTRLVGHGGKAAGVFFEYYYYPQLDYTLIMFSNSDASSPEVLFNKINQYITDSEAKPESGFSTSGTGVPYEVRLVARPNPEDLVKEIRASETAHSALTRYLNVSNGLIEAIHGKNLSQFNSFFSDLEVVKKAANESMFQFMTDEAIPIRGRIAQVHALSEPMKMRQSDYPVRALVFHLADGSPGSISFSLNPEGKIDHLSLFVHEQICPNRKTKDCHLVEKTIH